MEVEVSYVLKSTFDVYSCAVKICFCFKKKAQTKKLTLKDSKVKNSKLNSHAQKKT